MLWGASTFSPQLSVVSSNSVFQDIIQKYKWTANQLAAFPSWRRMCRQLPIPQHLAMALSNKTNDYSDQFGSIASLNVPSTNPHSSLSHAVSMSNFRIIPPLLDIVNLNVWIISWHMIIFSTPCLPWMKAFRFEVISSPNRGFNLLATIFDTSLIHVLHRLMGLKHLIDVGFSSLGIITRWASETSTGISSPFRTFLQIHTLPPLSSLMWSWRIELGICWDQEF